MDLKLLILFLNFSKASFSFTLGEKLFHSRLPWKAKEDIPHESRT